jgi:hypothetical protein
MCSSPMKKLFSIGGKSVYWADKRFQYRGVWIWTGAKNVRIVPFNRFFEKET